MQHKSPRAWQGAMYSVDMQLAHGITLNGDLNVPVGATDLVIFVHGSGSSRLSRRNKYVANQFNSCGIGTLLFDLLTLPEEKLDSIDGRFRFDIDILSSRVVEATKWISEYPETSSMRLGYFGASTGAAAALVAGAELRPYVKAIVSRGGRPDLAAEHLREVFIPTLLIVGEYDHGVLKFNRDALRLLSAKEKALAIVPKAGHLFEEPGALDIVSRLAVRWFETHFSDQSDLGFSAFHSSINDTGVTCTTSECD